MSPLTKLQASARRATARSVICSPHPRSSPEDAAFASASVRGSHLRCENTDRGRSSVAPPAKPSVSWFTLAANFADFRLVHMVRALPNDLDHLLDPASDRATPSNATPAEVGRRKSSCAACDAENGEAAPTTGRLTCCTVAPLRRAR